MKREELEIRITEAIDGELTKNQTVRLQEELKAYPDLLDAWVLLEKEIRLKEAYPLKPANPIAIQKIRDRAHTGLSEAIISLFPGYLLAAAIAVFMLTGIFQYRSHQQGIPDSQLFEWIHTADHELVFHEIPPIILTENNNGATP
jgi:hypothetical protein